MDSLNNFNFFESVKECESLYKARKNVARFEIA